VDRCYLPLSDLRSEIDTDSGFSPAPLSRRLSSLLSPWSAAVTLDPEHLVSAAAYVDGVLSHWAGLLKSDAPELQATSELAGRDAAHRKLLFSRSVDPSWDKLDRLLGREAVDQLLGAMSGS
jgi:hypothetical protein